MPPGDLNRETTAGAEGEPAPSLRPRERGRARRRLRYLRNVRELALRDLGGFVLDLYRFGEQRDQLVRDKLDGIVAVDKEIRALEGLLGDGGRSRDVRQPGVGGTCGNCGAFHGTDARFCARCGVELRRPAQPRPEPQPEPEPQQAEPQEPEPQPIVLRPVDGVPEGVPQAYAQPAPGPEEVAGEDGDAAGEDTSEFAAVRAHGRRRKR